MNTMSNDKTQVIIAVPLLGLCSMYFFGIQAKEIISAVIGGLFGLSVGQAMDNK